MEAVQLIAQKGARPMLETLQAYPRRQFSINELSKISHTPFSTAWNLVQKFERAQIVDVGLIGKTRTVQFNESPFSKLVLQILDMSTTLQRQSLAGLTKMLKANPAIKEAHLFGSVAANKEKLESDIDVAILAGRPLNVPFLMSTMREKYGVKVMPLEFKSKKEFDDFLSDKKTVKLV